VVLSAVIFAPLWCNFCTTLAGAIMRHLKIYRAIRLIARQGSIRKAAESLAVSPSALNRSIQAFEDEMNLSVFERIPGGVRLSAAGELLIDMIDRHLTEFDAMQGQLSNLQDGLSGRLRISLGADVGAGLLLAAVAEFQRDFPGVSVDVTSADTIEPLQRRAVDLAVLSNPVTDDTVEVLHAHPVALAAWQGGPPTGAAPPVALWEAVDHLLVLPPHGTGTRIAISHLLRRHRLNEGVTTTLAAAQLAHHMAGGGSVCIFPEIVMGTDRAGSLQRLDIALGQVQIAILRATRAPMTRSAQAFLVIVQRHLDTVTP
jgi:DNA-binding transcriptional LysR family regulator